MHNINMFQQSRTVAWILQYRPECARIAGIPFTLDWKRHWSHARPYRHYLYIRMPDRLSCRPAQRAQVKFKSPIPALLSI
jgi:hypothetical protein